MIRIAGVALLFWHQIVGATLVSIDFTFQDYNFAVFTGGNGSGDVVFRVSYDSNAPDGNSGDTNVGSYTGTEVLRTGGQTSSIVPTIIQVFSNGSGNAGRDEFSVIPQRNFSPALPVFGIQIENATFQMFGPASQMFTSDAPPLTPAFVSGANSALVQVVSGESAIGQAFGQDEFHVDSAPVPEPSAYILLLAVLAGMFSVFRLRPGTRER